MPYNNAFGQGLTTGGNLGAQIVDNFERTRARLQDREDRKAAQAAMTDLQRRLKEKGDMLAPFKEKYEQLNARVTAGDKDVTEEMVLSARTEVAWRSMALYQEQMGLVMEVAAQGTGNKYLEQSVSQLGQHMLTQLQQVNGLAKGIADDRLQIMHREDVQSHNQDMALLGHDLGERAADSAFERREAGADADLDRGKDAAEHKFGLSEQAADNQQGRELRDPRTRMQILAEGAEFIRMLQDSGMSEEMIQKSIGDVLPSGVTVADLMDRYSQYTDATKTELKDLEQYEKRLLKRQEEGEDVAEELRDTRVEIESLRAVEDEHRLQAIKRRQWRRENPGVPGKYLPEIRDKVRSAAEISFALSPIGVGKSIYDAVTSSDQLPAREGSEGSRAYEQAKDRVDAGAGQ